MYGMPIGPPSHRPDPKSAFNPAELPMLAMYVDDLASTGRCDTSAYQQVSPGNIGQSGASGSAESGAGEAEAAACAVRGAAIIAGPTSAAASTLHKATRAARMPPY